jgi:selenocysteine-specific elongation factor
MSDRQTPSAILGTAGHIDHGKTALVRALTGVDTDRLAEEKARGITIELGFAELAREGRPHFGVVDVPGHEGFVRAMVAGAAGMDVVLLVVAADEGMMPQTREHLAIVELLGVPELVVALTKCDLVEDDWLELVDADVADALAATPFAGASRVRTSATAGTGLDELLDALDRAADRARADARDDLVRLPLDRVFTIQGAGTVGTGTLWGGRLTPGDRARILPAALDARVRSVQVHGRDVDAAEAGDRVAVALAGDGADRSAVERGQTLVTDAAWAAARMLTARVRLLEAPGWSLEHNQRVHVHLGTAEVLARCALLGDRSLGPGETGWVQLRLEEPTVARVRDRFVIRAYSPVTTIGGGVVGEVLPPKRRTLDADERSALGRVVDGDDAEAVAAHLELAGWRGAEVSALSLHTGLTPRGAEAALDDAVARGALRAGGRVFARDVREGAERAVLGAVDRGHAEDGLRPAVSLASVRSAIPSWAAGALADAAVSGLVSAGTLEAAEGGVRHPGHRPRLDAGQEAASAELERIFAEGGLAPPPVDELPAPLVERPDFWSLVRRLETRDVVRQVADGLYVRSEDLDRAAARIREELGGRSNLGPADFREALPVSRKHLIPLLNYFDGRGTTVRGVEGRDVPAQG